MWSVLFLGLFSWHPFFMTLAVCWTVSRFEPIKCFNQTHPYSWKSVNLWLSRRNWEQFAEGLVWSCDFLYFFVVVVYLLKDKSIMMSNSSCLSFPVSSPSSWQKPYSSSPPMAPPSKGFPTRQKAVFTGSCRVSVCLVQSWVWQPLLTTSTWMVKPTSPPGTVYWACSQSAWCVCSPWLPCLSSTTLWPKAGPWPNSNATMQQVDLSHTCWGAPAFSSASARPGSLHLLGNTPGTCQHSALLSLPSTWWTKSPEPTWPRSVCSPDNVDTHWRLMQALQCSFHPFDFLWKRILFLLYGTLKVISCCTSAKCEQGGGSQPGGLGPLEGSHCLGVRMTRWEYELKLRTDLIHVKETRVCWCCCTDFGGRHAWKIWKTLGEWNTSLHALLHNHHWAHTGSYLCIFCQVN